jgi:hypothetical protein
MATVYSPNRKFNGVSVGVTFTDGKGETDDDVALAYFARRGYGIDEPPADTDTQAGDTGDVDPVVAVTELRDAADPATPETPVKPDGGRDRQPEGDTPEHPPVGDPDGPPASDVDPPAKSAPRGDWEDYARTLGLTDDQIDDASNKETLIDLCEAHTAS